MSSHPISGWTCAFCHKWVSFGGEHGHGTIAGGYLASPMHDPGDKPPGVRVEYYHTDAAYQRVRAESAERDRDYLRDQWDATIDRANRAERLLTGSASDRGLVPIERALSAEQRVAVLEKVLQGLLDKDWLWSRPLPESTPFHECPVCEAGAAYDSAIKHGPDCPLMIARTALLALEGRKEKP